MNNLNSSASVPVAIEPGILKKNWINPELVLITKESIEANNPFDENDHVLY